MRRKKRNGMKMKLGDQTKDKTRMGTRLKEIIYVSLLGINEGND